LQIHWIGEDEVPALADRVTALVNGHAAATVSPEGLVAMPRFGRLASAATFDGTK
jgi:hypothetical protein